MTKYEYNKTMESLCLESARYTEDEMKKVIFGNCATGFSTKAFNLEDPTAEADEKQLLILERFKAETLERKSYWEGDNE